MRQILQESQTCTLSREIFEDFPNLIYNEPMVTMRPCDHPRDLNYPGEGNGSDDDVADGTEDLMF